MRRRRSSLRLQKWDYAGYDWYHITIRVREERCSFGFIDHGVMHMNTLGAFMENYIRLFPFLYQFVRVDTYQIMPDHLHMIVEIADGSGVPFDHFVPYGDPRIQTVPLKRKPLGNVIGAFKTVTTREINAMCFALGTRIWQRKYHDRIIQNEKELEQVREYILRNPEKWAQKKISQETMSSATLSS